eukprot:scaffold57976_cov56-Attheya_sp.AAC.2
MGMSTVHCKKKLFTGLAQSKRTSKGEVAFSWINQLMKSEIRQKLWMHLLICVKNDENATPRDPRRRPHDQPCKAESKKKTEGSTTNQKRSFRTRTSRWRTISQSNRGGRNSFTSISRGKIKTDPREQETIISLCQHSYQQSRSTIVYRMMRQHKEGTFNSERACWGKTGRSASCIDKRRYHPAN